MVEFHFSRDMDIFHPLDKRLFPIFDAVKALTEQKKKIQTLKNEANSQKHNFHTLLWIIGFFVWLESIIPDYMIGGSIPIRSFCSTLMAQ